MSTEQAEVHCGQCKLYRWHKYPYGPLNERCTHTSNVKWRIDHGVPYTTEIWTPAEKNVNNDCTLYEPMAPTERDK